MAKPLTPNPTLPKPPGPNVDHIARFNNYLIISVSRAFSDVIRSVNALIKEQVPATSIADAPPRVGAIAVVGTTAYIAVGTSDPSDWKVIT